MQRFGKMDASEHGFFEKSLEVVKQQVIERKYPNLKARTLIPVDNSVDSGASTVSFRQYDAYGMAKIISNYADDLPRVDVKGEEVVVKLKSLGDAFGYNIQEIRAARLAGVPLEQRKANAARRVMEEKLDSIAATGDTLTGMLGLLNQTNALTYTVGNGALGTATWATKTPDEILTDLNGIALYPVTQTKNSETVDTLLLPDDKYALISTMARSTNTDTTIMEFFLKNSPYIRNIEPWTSLTGAGSGVTDRMVAYRRDPDVLQLIIPQEFEMFPPEPRNLEFVVDCHMRTGGVVAYLPLAIVYGDGI